MSMLMRFTALAVTMTAAFSCATIAGHHPGRAAAFDVGAWGQPGFVGHHSRSQGRIRGWSRVPGPWRPPRWGVPRWCLSWRLYRGGVYRGGVYRGGVYRRAGIGYGAMCGYAPYPPCAGGYAGGVLPWRGLSWRCLSRWCRVPARWGVPRRRTIAAVDTGRIEEAVGDRRLKIPGLATAAALAAAAFRLEGAVGRREAWPSRRTVLLDDCHWDFDARLHGAVLCAATDLGDLRV